MVNPNSLSCGFSGRRTFCAAYILRNLMFSSLFCWTQKRELRQYGPEQKCSICLQDYEIARGWKAIFRSFQVLGYLGSGVMLSCLFQLICLWLRTLQENERSCFASNLGLLMQCMGVRESKFTLLHRHALWTALPGMKTAGWKHWLNRPTGVISEKCEIQCFVFILNSQEPLSKMLHQPPAAGVSLLTSLLQGC